MGGRWHVPIWDQYSSTARRVYGSGVEVAPNGLRNAEQVEAAARSFIAAHPALFGNPSDSDLRTHRISNALGKWSVLFQQTEHGIPVADAMLNLVFTDAGRLFAFGSGFYENLSAPTTPLIGVIEARAIAQSAVLVDTSSARYTRPSETMILPTLDTQSDPPQMTFRLAHRIDVPTREPFGLYETYVDAISGEVVRRLSMTPNTYAGTVTGDVEILHPCDGITADTLLRHLDVDIGGNVVATGSDGSFSASGPADSAFFDARLRGPYVDVDVAPRLNNLGQYASIAVDSATGMVAITCQNRTGLDLMYAVKSNGRWAIETIDLKGDAPLQGGDVGSYSSVFLDAGVPHAAYLQQDTGGVAKLRYATRSGGIWIWDKETIADAATSYYGLHASLKMSGGEPRICYEDVVNKDLRFAYKIGSTWTVELVNAVGAVGPYCSLEITGNVPPRISYFDTSNSALRYAYRTVALGLPGPWTNEIVDNLGDVGRWSSLELDGGYPYISYYDQTSSALKLASRPGASWSVEQVDNAADVGKHSSLARAADGTLHVAYFDETNDNLKYIRKVGSSWQPAVVVDAPGDVGRYCSIALDAEGRPHIAYYDATNLDLKYAWLNGAVWNVEKVDAQEVLISGTMYDNQPAAIQFAGGAMSRAEVDAFFFANVAHDFAQSVYPQWWVVPDSVPKAIVVVDHDTLVPGGDTTPPFTITLKSASEPFGAPAFSRARLASVVGHEYSHGIQYHLAGGFFQAKGMREGTANLGATFITDLPFTQDAYEDCNLTGCCGCQNTLQFPDDVVGVDIDDYEAGDVLCGFNWDVRMGIAENFPDDAKRLTAQLWMGSLKLFGYSGYAMPEQVADYWLLDDDNGDLADGVPHGKAIQDAAQAHGFSDIIWTNNLQWSIQTPATGLPAGASNAISMAFDLGSRAHVAYVGADSNAVRQYKYVKRPCATWTGETVIAATSGGNAIDIAVPSGAMPVVAYETIGGSVGQERAEFWYSASETGWQPEAIASKDSKLPSGVTIELDANDGVHTCFGTAELNPFAPGPKIWYTRRLGSAWNPDTLVASGSRQSFALAPNGDIGICYSADGQVKYAKRPSGGSGWTIGVIDGSGTLTIASTSLAFDTNSNPHVCYASGDTLSYSGWTGAAWSAPEIVDQALPNGASFARGLYSSIAVASDGVVSISYHDEYTGDLRYARKESTTWEIDVVDRVRDTGESTSLRLLPSGEPVIAYFQKTDGLLRVAAGGAPKTPNAFTSILCEEVARGAGMQGSGDDVPIVRLCPSGDYDQVTFDVTLKDVLGAPMNNYTLSLVEMDGSVNIAGGGPTGTTNGSGAGQITLSAASGSGRVGLCAGGKILTAIEVRSPDVAGAGDAPSYCAMPTGASIVDGFDLTNTSCGFESMFGPVVPSVNRWWDLNGDGTVSSVDTDGWLEGSTVVGGVDQHNGHTAVLGAENSCGGAGKSFDFDDVAAPPPAEEARDVAPNRDLYTGLLASLGRELAVIPNPASGQARIVWAAREAGRARAEVYDVSGRRVRVLAVDPPAPGVRVVDWDGMDSGGVRAGSGIYFVRLSFPGGTLVERFTLLR